EALGVVSTYITGPWLQQRFGSSVPVAGYCSWGTNEYGSRSSTEWGRPKFAWKRGAVSMNYVSTDARTLIQSDLMASTNNSIVYASTWSNPAVVQMYNIYVGWRAELHDNTSGLTYSAIASGGQ